MTSLSQKTILLLEISILIFVLVHVFGQETSNVKFVTNSTESEQNFGDCWYSANFSCMKTMALETLNAVKKEKEVKLTNSIFIEKIANASKQEHDSKYESRGFDVEVVNIVEEVLDFVKNHALKIDLWGIGKLRIGRSLDNPDNLEIVFDMNKSSAKGVEEGIVYFNTHF